MERHFQYYVPFTNHTQYTGVGVYNDPPGWNDPGHFTLGWNAPGHFTLGWNDPGHSTLRVE